MFTDSISIKARTEHSGSYNAIITTNRTKKTMRKGILESPYWTDLSLEDGEGHHKRSPFLSGKSMPPAVGECVCSPS